MRYGKQMHNDAALNTVVCVPSDKRIFFNRTKDVLFLILSAEAPEIVFSNNANGSNGTSNSI